MQKDAKISKSLAKRLPRYYRYALTLFGNDVLRISSTELAQMMGITPSQVRQDLSSLGEFGLSGYGYRVKELFFGLGDIIGLKEGYNIAIVGMGNIGRAMMESNLIKSRGIKVKGLFDYYNRIGEVYDGKKVMPIIELKDFCQKNKIDIVALCVEKELAIEACSLAIEGGVKGIWDLTGEELRPEKLGKDIKIVDLNFFDSLAELFCLM